MFCFTMEKKERKRRFFRETSGLLMPLGACSVFPLRHRAASLVEMPVAPMLDTADTHHCLALLSSLDTWKATYPTPLRVGWDHATC